MDINAVVEAGKRIVDRTRNGGGPYILEMLTYRYRGHSMSDPAQYRTRDEVNEVRDQSDPIESVKNRILKKKILSEKEIKDIDISVKKQILEAADFAENSPLPDPSELWNDIYIK